MLWYKMWRESRTRFAISAVALLWMCGAVVAMQQRVRSHADEPMSYADYIWSAVYKANVLDLFTLLVIVLGLGGVLQERAQGTAGFTLSLPVSRWRLVAVRAAVGVGQVAALAALPGLLVPLISPLFGEVYSFALALQHSVLWAVCGMFIYGLAFFFSAVLPGAYSPVIASIAGLVLYSVLARLPLVKQYPALDLFQTMRGTQLANFHGVASLATFAAALPWLTLALYALAALGLVLAACSITVHRDF